MVTDELNRLVSMITQTNLTALDKTITTVIRAQKDSNPKNSVVWTYACNRVGSIGERMTRAAAEVKATLPEERAKLAAEYSRYNATVYPNTITFSTIQDPTRRL